MPAILVLRAGCLRVSRSKEFNDCSSEASNTYRQPKNREPSRNQRLWKRYNEDPAARKGLSTDSYFLRVVCAFVQECACMIFYSRQVKRCQLASSVGAVGSPPACTELHYVLREPTIGESSRVPPNRCVIASSSVRPPPSCCLRFLCS